MSSKPGRGERSKAQRDPSRDPGRVFLYSKPSPTQTAPLQRQASTSTRRSHSRSASQSSTGHPPAARLHDADTDGAMCLAHVSALQACQYCQDAEAYMPNIALIRPFYASVLYRGLIQVHCSCSSSLPSVGVHVLYTTVAPQIRVRISRKMLFYDCYLHRHASGGSGSRCSSGFPGEDSDQLQRASEHCNHIRAFR